MQLLTRQEVLSSHFWVEMEITRGKTRYKGIKLDLPSWLHICMNKLRERESVSESHSVVSTSLRPHGLYSPWNSPGQNTGVGSCFLLQLIFPTQGSNPGLLHCRQILYQLRHQGSPRILEWIAYSFSSRSSQLRNQTGVCCIASRFYTRWATREGRWREREIR